MSLPTDLLNRSNDGIDPQKPRSGQFLLMRNARHDWIAIALLHIVFAASLQYPILTGKIPLPANLINSFPAWPSTPQAPAEPVIDRGLGDLVTLFYPWRAFAAESLKEGRLPVWNPLVLGGTPFVADSQSAIYFPLNWLYILLPVASAWAILFIVRTALAGISMTLFARSLGVHPTAAMCSGIVFMTCGYITAWSGNSLGESDIWLPLACYAVVRLSEQQIASSVVLAAAAFSLPVLAGHPETAAHISLTAFAVGIFQYFRIAAAHRLRFVVLFLGAVVLSAGIAAAQTVPTLEWLQYTSTSLDLRWPPRPMSWVAALLSRDLSSNPNSIGIGIPEGAAYAGVVTLLLSAVALAGPSRKTACFYAALAVVAAGIVYGVDPFHWLSTITPIVSGLKNMRLILVLEFSLSFLLGIGMSNLIKAPLRRYRYVVLAAAAVIGWGLLKVGNLQIAKLPFRVSVALTAILLMLGLAAILLRVHSRLTPRVFSVFVATIVVIDSSLFSFGFVPVASPDEVFPPSPVFEFLKAHVTEWDRVGTVDTAIPVNSTSMYGLRSLDGYDYVLQSMDRVFADFREKDLTGVGLHSRRIVQISDRRLDMMGVKYLIAASANHSADTLASRPERFALAYSYGSIRVFENLNALKSVSLIPLSNVEVVPSRHGQLQRLRETFNPESSAIVSRLPVAFPPGPASESGNSAERISATPHQIRVRAVARTPVILVVNEAYYPGWTVRVDGKPETIVRANYALFGVGLGPGSHDILFEFQSRSIAAGIAVTLLTLTLCGVVLMYGRDQSRLQKLTLASAALVIAALAAAALAVERRTPSEPAPGNLELSRTEVTAADSIYTLRIAALSNAKVAIRYSLNGGKLDQIVVSLDDKGETTFEVSPATPRGIYRFVGFRETYGSDWAPANVQLNVK